MSDKKELTNEEICEELERFAMMFYSDTSRPLWAGSNRIKEQEKQIKQLEKQLSDLTPHGIMNPFPPANPPPNVFPMGPNITVKVSSSDSFIPLSTEEYLKIPEDETVCSYCKGRKQVLYMYPRPGGPPGNQWIPCPECCKDVPVR